MHYCHKGNRSIGRRNPLSRVFSTIWGTTHPQLSGFKTIIMCSSSWVWVYWFDLLLWGVPLAHVAAVSWDGEIIQLFLSSPSTREHRNPRGSSQVFFQDSTSHLGKEHRSCDLGPDVEQWRIQEIEKKQTVLIWTVKETKPLPRGNTGSRWLQAHLSAKALSSPQLLHQGDSSFRARANLLESLYASPHSLLKGQDVFLPPKFKLSHLNYEHCFLSAFKDQDLAHSSTPCPLYFSSLQNILSPCHHRCSSLLSAPEPPVLGHCLATAILGSAAVIVHTKSSQDWTYSYFLVGRAKGSSVNMEGFG